MEMSQMEGVDDAGEWHLTTAADESGKGQNTCTVTEVQNTQKMHTPNSSTDLLLGIFPE